MAKINNPFEVDFSKIVGEFKMPVLDVQQLIAIQRKNIEAFTAANQVTVEGVQALLRRQAEIVKNSIEEANSLVNEIHSAGTPEDKLVRQVDLLKQTYDQVLSQTKELSDIYSKCKGEASELIAGRISDSLDEIKAVTKKVTSKKVA